MDARTRVINTIERRPIDRIARYDAFWGNIDVRKLAGPADTCKKEAKEKITAAKQMGGYMYHSDHSIPPDLSFDRYRWIMELLQTYGQCG